MKINFLSRDIDLHTHMSVLDNFLSTPESRYRSAVSVVVVVVVVVGSFEMHKPILLAWRLTVSSPWNQITNKTQAQHTLSQLTAQRHTHMVNLNICEQTSVLRRTENPGVEYTHISSFAYARMCGRYWRNYVISFLQSEHDSFLLISHQSAQ